MHKNLKQMLACGLSITCMITGMYSYKFVDASQSTDTKGKVEATKEIPNFEPSFCSGAPVVTTPSVEETVNPIEPTLTAVPSESVDQTPANEFVQKIELEDNVIIEKISDRNAKVTFKNSTQYAMINYIREDYIIGRTSTSQYNMTKVGDTWTGDFSYILEGSKMTMCITYSGAKTAFGTKMKATKPITFEFTKEGMRLIETEASDFEPYLPEASETFVPEPTIDISNRPDQPGLVHDIGNVGYYYSDGSTSGTVNLEKKALIATMFYSLDLGKTWQAKSMYTGKYGASVYFSHGTDPVGVSFLYVDLNGTWKYSGPYFFKHALGFSSEKGGKFEPKTYDTFENGCVLPVTEEKTIKELIPIYSWAGSGPTPTDIPEPTASGPEPTAPIRNKDVKADCQYSGEANGCINENFVVTSTGKKDIQLSKLTIRHYYSVDGNLPQFFTCNHAGFPMC